MSFAHVSRIMLVAVLLSPSLAWAELDANQQKMLEHAQSLLRQANANLKLAMDSAGKGTPKGSKAKLAAMRLAAAKSPMTQVTTIFEKLPASDPSVQAFKNQIFVTETAIQALEKRLTGNSTPAPAATGKKLDYKQVEELKNANFTLRELAGLNGALEKLVGEVQSIENESLFDFREMAKGMNTVNKARGRLQYTQNHLQDLPADGQGVKEAADQLKRETERVDAAEQALLPTHTLLLQAINPSSYPDYQGDLARLREMSSMYASPQILTSSREQAARVIGEAQAAVVEHDRITKAYYVIIHQQTEEGKRLGGVSKGFSSNFTDFMVAVDRERATLPSQIQSDFDKAISLADQAVQEQKPLFFTGGVAQNLDAARDKMVLYAALDASGSKAMQDKLAQVEAELKKRSSLLKDAIIAANSLPPNLYQGADRAALESLALKTWKKEQPNSTLMTVRIPSENWKREVLWRNQTGTWYKIDRSKLQVQLIVEHDDRLAVVRPVNLWKDHLSNDQIKAFPFHSIKDELQPMSFLPKDKVK
jgi:hypothetical protein